MPAIRSSYISESAAVCGSESARSATSDNGQHRSPEVASWRPQNLLEDSAAVHRESERVGIPGAGLLSAGFGRRSATFIEKVKAAASAKPTGVPRHTPLVIHHSGSRHRYQHSIFAVISSISRCGAVHQGSLDQRVPPASYLLSSTQVWAMSKPRVSKRCI